MFHNDTFAGKSQINKYYSESEGYCFMTCMCSLIDDSGLRAGLVQRRRIVEHMDGGDKLRKILYSKIPIMGLHLYAELSRAIQLFFIACLDT